MTSVAPQGGMAGRGGGLGRDLAPALMLACVVLVSVTWLAASQALPSDSPSDTWGVRAAGGQPWRVWLLLAAAPCVEEIILRLGVQEPLWRRWRSAPWAANLAAAVVFGAAHAALRADAWALTLALPALALGAAFQRWRSVGVCIAIHAGMNAVWLAGAQAWLRPWSGA